MSNGSPGWRGWPGRRLVGLVGLGWLLAGGPALAAEPEGPSLPPVNAAPAVAAAPLDLPTARRIALERQPALVALRASLAAAKARLQAVESLPSIPVISPEVPIRRKQAALGVEVAQAQLHQQEWETLYAVTRNYLSYLYARAQEQLVRDILKRLAVYREQAEKALGDALPGVESFQLRRVIALEELGRARLQEATQGAERARAAMYEAMGLPPGECPPLLDIGLPYAAADLHCEHLVPLALNRRNELVQAHLASEVTALEIQAQAAIHQLAAPTFAAASDIHAQPVTQGERNGEYRPGAVNLEMPGMLVGKRAYRVEQAWHYHERAKAIVEKTRNLVILEVRNAYLLWLEAANGIPELRKALAAAEQSLQEAEQRYRPEVAETRATLTDVINARLQVTQLRLQLNESIYHYALQLAALERATAGGVCPAFAAPPPAPEPKEATENGALPLDADPAGAGR